MLTRNRGALMALGVLLALPMAANAVVLTWAMEGTIQSVNDPWDLLGYAQPGGHVVYTFTFDSDAPDTNSTPTLGTYLGNASTFDAAGTLILVGSPQIDVQRDPTFHANDFFNVGSWFEPGNLTGSVYFRLLDPLGTGLTSTALPLQPYDLASFASTEFSCTVQDPSAYGRSASFWGQIDSLYAIPEPASLALLGMAGLVLNSRRGR